MRHYKLRYFRFEKPNIDRQRQNHRLATVHPTLKSSNQFTYVTANQRRVTIHRQSKSSKTENKQEP